MCKLKGMRTPIKVRPTPTDEKVELEKLYRQMEDVRICYRPQYLG